MAQKQTVSIPASLIPELEAWGEMTARLFGRLRREAGLQAVKLPDDQSWFWTDEWQSGEKAVDDALAKGEFQDFKDADSLIKALQDAL